MATIIPVQVLRGAAALAVAVLHGQHEAGIYAGLSGGTFAHGRTSASPALPWEAGVDVFFVISGFVMVHASRGLFGRPGARRRFLAHRVARVVPLYWLATTLYLALTLVAPRLLNGAAPTPGYVAASYLFVPVARPDGLVQPLYSLGWTLNYEMFFYALFALAIGLDRRRAAAAILGTLALLSGAGLALSLPQPLATWSDPLLLEFGAGIALGLLRSEGVGLGGLLRIALALAGLSLFAVQDGVSLDGEPLAGLARALLYGVPAACLVAACGLGRDDATPESRAARWSGWVGDASYALYLTHPFAIRGTREAFRIAGLAPSMPADAFLGVALAAAVAAAVLVHRVVERPLTRAARRLLDPA